MPVTREELFNRICKHIEDEHYDYYEYDGMYYPTEVDSVNEENTTGDVYCNELDCNECFFSFINGKGNHDCSFEFFRLTNKEDARFKLAERYYDDLLGGE